MSLTGQTALVTGASSGIGAAFAHALAQRQVDLVLVARSDQRLRETAARLHEAHGVRVEAIAEDLSREHAAQAVARRLQELQELGREVDILVNNAGFATQGRFDAIPAERDHEQIMVNVATVVDLTHALLPGMVARGTGTIVNVSSLGGFQPAPYLAVYGATKAFVLSFSQALAAELRGRGVHVLALCPGPVRTPFFDVLGSRQAAIGQELTADAVVAAALRALEDHRSLVVPGWRNRLTAAGTRLLPRSLVLTLAERATRDIAAV